MASIIHEFDVDADVTTAWSALEDPARIGTLLTFLGPVTVDGDQRTCSLGELGTLQETMIAVDHDARRIAYTITDAAMPFTHHHASMQATSVDGVTRCTWTTEFAPDELTHAVAPLLDQGVTSIEQELNR